LRNAAQKWLKMRDTHAVRNTRVFGRVSPFLLSSPLVDIPGLLWKKTSQLLCHHHNNKRFANLGERERERPDRTWRCSTTGRQARSRRMQHSGEALASEEGIHVWKDSHPLVVPCARTSPTVVPMTRYTSGRDRETKPREREKPALLKEAQSEGLVVCLLLCTSFL
jgi:hypothetical protein